MDNKPKIHYVRATTFEESERKVNAWIESLDYLCTVLTVQVMPLIIEGKLVILTVLMYTGQAAYAGREEGPDTIHKSA